MIIAGYKLRIPSREYMARLRDSVIAEQELEKRRPKTAEQVYRAMLVKRANKLKK